MIRSIAEEGSSQVLWVVIGGLATAMIYAYVALSMPIGNSWTLVSRFLLSFGTAGAIAATLWWHLSRQAMSRSSLRAVLGFAILFRLFLLPAGFQGPDPLEAMVDDLTGGETGYGKFLLYDNDVWRYVWDGHVAGAGYSPYAFAPSRVLEDEALEEDLLRNDRSWDVYDNLGFRDLVTVYPPLAQLFFRLAGVVAPASVLAIKLGAVAADVAICFLLVGVLRRFDLPLAGVVLYAWNPLVLKEVAGSAHFEPLMLLLLLLGVDLATRGRGAASAIAVAGAGLAKLSPLAVVPVLARRLRPREALLGLVVLVLGVIPFWTTFDGWLRTMVVYSREWSFNSGAWSILRVTLDWVGVADAASWAALACRAVAVGVMVWIWRRDDGSPGAAYRGCFTILAWLVLLSPAVMPWYLLWALPFAIIARYPAWPFFCVLSLLSYGFYAGEVELVWWRVVEYGGLGLAWAAQSRWRRTEGARPGVAPA